MPSPDQTSPFAAGPYFEHATFSGLDLPAADLSGKEFFGCTFKSLKLQESLWNKARLEDCVFEDCDLTRMQPKRLVAYGVEMRGCKLMGIDWTDLAPNPQLSFADCNLRYASFVSLNLRKTRFLRCRVTEANFVGVDLREADFADSDLTGSTLADCQLGKADFSRARGVCVNPAKNRVKDAVISLESAVLVAMSFGMKVSGFGEDETSG